MPKKKTLDESWDDKDVDAIYQAYPRHVGKIAAHEAIRKALSRRHRRQYSIGKDYGERVRALTIAWMVKRTLKYAASDVGQGKCFIGPPYPATWFNQGRYDDDEKEWRY